MLAVGAVVAGAAGLLVLSTGAAWAQGSDSSPSSSSPSSSSPSSSSGSSSSSSTPGGNLGGFNLASSAAGISADYEQPNFPIPANPSLEFDVGYSTASYDAGPVGAANASALWPGPVIAGGGSQLPLFIDPYLEQYAGPLASTLEPLIPTSVTYPMQAPSAYPGGPATASNNNGPMSMDSSTDATQSSATSSLALVGGTAAESALPAGMLKIAAVSSTSQDTIDSLGNAVSEASSTVHDINLAGFIDISSVSSTATSSSDGNNASLSGSSTVTGVTIAGEPVTVSSSGVSVVGNNENVLGSLVPSVNQILSTAGITMALTNPTDTVSGAAAERQLHGLAVTIDLSTFDQDFSKLVSELPSQLTSSLNQLPIPTPYKQTITLDFGWVQVNAAASPPFTLSLGGTSTGSGGDLGLGSTGGGALPTGGTGGLPGTGSTGTPSGTGSGSLPVLANTTPALFKGIGTGLIILGLVLAAIVAGLLVGIDRAVGRLAAAVPCVGEDTGDLG